ncbi:hypothetical protein BDN70DRAFT_998335 [Pholiota conissans]|uniref:SigF-like NTF2-like domain-containing protein n=1 Tax=Pholiota conissans TaxID=109636 RepID=A0A9P5YLP3_9AGAR|nr:hypothetical protein BDN70DRAFT_998335 [Pholiota conissans]
MENPVEEIKAVVHQLTATNSPDIQKAALESYMTSDVAFRHPVCSVNAGPNSRDTMLGIYQWYRVLSPQIEIKVESIMFDSEKDVMILEGVQWFKLFFLPVKPMPARLIIRLTLRKQDGLYYISEQEDFYHPEDFAALLLPPIVPFVKFGLLASGTISGVLARASHLLGWWTPGPNAHEVNGHVEPSEAASEAGLYPDE